jgi:hypothetical protein
MAGENIIWHDELDKKVTIKKEHYELFKTWLNTWIYFFVSMLMETFYDDGS